MLGGPRQQHLCRAERPVLSRGRRALEQRQRVARRCSRCCTMACRGLLHVLGRRLLTVVRRRVTVRAHARAAAPDCARLHSARRLPCFREGQGCTHSAATPRCAHARALAHRSLRGNLLSGVLDASLGALQAATSMCVGGGARRRQNATRGRLTRQPRPASDLGDNLLTGVVPPAVASLPNLSVLRLDGNFFSGALPPALASSPLSTLCVPARGCATPTPRVRGARAALRARAATATGSYLTHADARYRHARPGRSSWMTTG